MAGLLGPVALADEPVLQKAHLRQARRTAAPVIALDDPALSPRASHHLNRCAHAKSMFLFPIDCPNLPKETGHGPAQT
jgi:hypothetical protein